VSKSKWMKQLSGLDGAVSTEEEVKIIQTPSPSLNWVFGKNNGILAGSSVLLFGEAKSGKSLVSYLCAGHLHQTDPEGIVIRFDTEMRSTFQMQGNWGIDYDRFQSIDSNDPVEVFDQITGPIASMVQDGMPLKMIIIDSMTNLNGLREKDADSIANVQMGDRAGAVTKGLKRILPFIRRNKIVFVGTAHMRANFDAGMYGPKLKASLAHAERHWFENYIEVKRDNAKEGKVDLLGNDLSNDKIKDFKGNKEITGHKIYVKMTENSLGVAGRTGEFTIDYEKGLINVHEEIFQLAINNNLVERPNNRTYIVEGVSYTSKAEFVTAIRDNEELQKYLLTKLNQK